ncbi:MAG: hypothetical protein ABI462_05695 [Ignavibacteria bacterium]
MLRYYFSFIILISFFLYYYGCDALVSNQSKPDVPPDHQNLIGGFLHLQGERNADGCSDCHGDDLRGSVATLNGRYIWVQSCYQCHGKLWDAEERK